MASFSRCSEEKRGADLEDFQLILDAYRFRSYDKESRGIQMRLLHLMFPMVMNIKKIRRLMNKYRLFCPVWIVNLYRRMVKALQTNHIADNLVNREFEDHGPGKVLLTDITYWWSKLTCQALSRGKRLPSEWVSALLADAVQRGITDGTRPRDFVTREECAVMTRAAAKF